MAKLRTALLIFSVFLTALAARIALAQVESGQWKLEQVVTSDGKTYRGLIREAAGGEIEIIEVVRPRGRPMYLVVRPLAAKDIASQRRLSAEERSLLAKRIYAFRFRARIEAGRMEGIELAKVVDDSREFLRYRGPWFTLDSTADEELTRRCIVRTEQIFRAYRQMLPPRTEALADTPERPLRFVLFASMDEYRTYLKKFGPGIENPAIYSQKENSVVVGGELARFAERLAIARKQHEKLRQQYEELDKEMAERFAEIRKQLKAAGVAKKQIDKEIDARTNLWNTQRNEAFLQLNTADRRNDQRFREVTDAMFARLYHEALHAYVENYLFPRSQYEVPIWLHEGLAQFFQSGRMEADTLRIDAPLPTALASAQRDLSSESPVQLLNVLYARRSDFLDSEQGQYLYAHAWALVFYLTIERGVLGTETLEQFVTRKNESPHDDAGERILRFQKLVGEPLLDFEQSWREAVLGMKSNGDP